MSDREFTGFHVDTVAEAVRQPPLADLRTAARSRRRQRTTGFAVAAVVMAGLVVTPLFGGSNGSGWAGPDQPPAGPARAGEVVLTSRDSGVAVIRMECALLFSHSVDEGRSWSDWDAARYEAESCPTNSAGNRNADLEYAVLSNGIYLVRDGERDLLSTDHGRTWQDADEATVPVADFPKRARPVFCQQGCAAVREPLAVDDATSTVYRLTGKSPSSYPPFSIYPAVDGSIWVTYWPGEAAQPIVARSADRGASWVSWRPQAGADVVAVLGVDAREGYLLIQATPPPGSTVPTGPARLLRTTDGARTWADTGTDLPATQQIPFLTIGADGAVLVPFAFADTPDLSAKLLVSRDGGRHFTVSRDYRAQEGTGAVAPGLAWLYGRDDPSDTGPDHVIVTTDGTTWKRFALPH
ncbi:WD40/YVTN/BNR-like repeat-containing protein [Micromonospora sp. CA-244673]|uniref:WD40/YVTN/BNR-like repeat-containing protein n=1 Tax=Micromonospora sp. CA-244673 TaxID=3239958 RepID=UPI003D901525